MKFLVERGANIEAKDDYTYTPLFIAAYKGHARVVDYLLSRKANPQVKVFSNNILFYTVSHPEVLSMILSRNRFDVNELSEYCTTPLMQAVVESDRLSEVVPILVRHGSDPSFQTPEACFSKTAIHIAVENGNVSAVRTLLGFKVKLNQRNKAGLTPSELAKQKGNAEIVRLLDAAGARTSPN